MMSYGLGKVIRRRGHVACIITHQKKSNLVGVSLVDVIKLTR